MNTFSRAIAATVLVMASTPLATAWVPDPGNIYYGLARDFLGNAYSPDSGAVVVMIRLHDGQETVIARSPILVPATGGSEVNYILRPSLDDGFITRFSPNAVLEGDTVDVYVEHEGTRFPIAAGPPCPEISDPVPSVQGRGSVLRVDFRTIDDNDGDCIADSWEMEFYQTTLLDGTQDIDGDGRSGLQEFLDGTHPLVFDPPTAFAPFALSFSGPADGIITIDWQAEGNLDYSILWSEDLVNFTPVPAERLVGPNQVDVDGFARMFFQVVGD